MRSLRVLSICALLWAAGCFPHASTSNATGPQTSPTVTVAASPRASAVSLSTAPVYVIASSAAKPVAQNTPLPLPTVTPYNAVKSVSSSGVKRAAPALVIPNLAPHILAIHISTLEIRSGETVSGYVTTSNNVSNVDIHISSWAMPVPKTHNGLFRASGVIPDLPFFLKGNYTLQVIARAPTGATVERDIPISIR